jgi:hypothetical protein
MTNKIKTKKKERKKEFNEVNEWKRIVLCNQEGILLCYSYVNITNELLTRVPRC